MTNVLITGGAGSLGQALARKLIADERVRRIAIYSRDEYKHAQMAQSISSNKLRYFLGDVRDRNRLCQAMQGIDTMVHAAALKRVDALAYNPSEVIKTNVHGTVNVIEAAISEGVSRVMFISSDKAVEPMNVYGVSKAMAEAYGVYSNVYAYPQGTKVACVRYGNVLGSR